MSNQDPTQPVFDEGQDAPQVKGRRSRFLGKLGRQAVSPIFTESVETVYKGSEVWTPEEVDLFGFESKLQEYQELWGEHKAVVANATEDPELLESLRAVLTLFAPNVPSNRRAAIRALSGKQGLSQFVRMYAMTGRLIATVKEPIVRKGPRAFGEANQRGNDINHLYARQRSILHGESTRILGPAVMAINEGLDRVKDESKRTYKPIFKIENDLSADILERLDRYPETASTLLDSFIQCAQSDVEVEKTFARFLANRYDRLGAESELGYAAAIMEKSSRNGKLAGEFLQAKIAEGGLLAFFAKRDERPKKEFVDSVVKDFDDWPTDIKESYELFVERRLRPYSNDLRQSIETAKYRPWQAPDLDAAKEVTERLLTTLYAQAVTTPHGGKAQPDSRSNGRAISRKRTIDDLLGGDIASPRQESAKEPLRVAGVEPGLERRYSRVEMIADEVVAKHLGDKPEDGQLTALYKDVINELRVHPFGLGVSSFKIPSIATINLDGKNSRVYRANPWKMENLTLTREMMQGRVVYTVDKGALCVIKIFRTHREYEQYLKLQA